MGLINFNELPTENGNKSPEPGCYKAHVKTKYLEPKEGKGASLQLTLKLTTFDGKNGGMQTDFLNEDATLGFLKYKMARFISAIGLPLTGKMELSDIAKIGDNKTIGVDISKRKDLPDMSQVDPFSGEVYYTEEELEERWKYLHPDVNIMTAEEVLARSDKAAKEASDGASDIYAEVETEDSDY